MPNSLYKDSTTLTWLENRDRLRLEGRHILRRVLNEAEEQMLHEFNEGLARGEVLELAVSKGAIKELLVRAAQKELGSGDAV